MNKDGRPISASEMLAIFYHKLLETNYGMFELNMRDGKIFFRSHQFKNSKFIEIPDVNLMNEFESITLEDLFIKAYNERKSDVTKFRLMMTYPDYPDRIILESMDIEWNGKDKTITTNNTYMYYVNN